MSATARRCHHRGGVAVARCYAMAALLLAALLAGCRVTVPARSGHGPEAATASMQVVTLNLWHDRNDWPRRQVLIVDALRRLQPDVILLQEVLQDAALPNQAESLAHQLGYSWHFVSVDPPDRVRRYGNAILTRQPPLARGERALPPQDDYRVAGWVRVLAGGRAVNFYVVHLNFTDRSGATRARQIGELLALVEATRGEAPVVIGGDFNTTAGSAELAPLRADYTDSYAAVHRGVDADGPAHATLNRRYNAPARIDHVFVQTGALSPVQARLILDQANAEGVWASDHFGVWVRLQWPTTP